MIASRRFGRSVGSVCSVGVFRLLQRLWVITHGKELPSRERSAWCYGGSILAKSNKRSSVIISHFLGG